MRLYYNPELLFKEVDATKVQTYYKRILELCGAIDKAKSLTPEIINQFKFKKMRGTDSIFKFYLNNQDASRCLVKYESRDDQIFDSPDEPGLILLRAVSHDEQGQVARAIQNDPLNDFQQFLLKPDEEDQSIIGDESIVANNLGKQYLKQLTIHHDEVSVEKMLQEMSDTSHKAIYKLSENQLLSLYADGPVFLMGSAGSGKTLVEICKALKNAHQPIQQGYFTFTPLLRETAENLYKKYQSLKGITGTTEFHTIRNYFLDLLKIPDTKHFSFEKFLVWYKEKKKNPNKNFNFIWKTDPVELWTEIRGIIKGYLGHSVFRIQDFVNNDYLSNQEVDDLIQRGILVRSKQNSQRYKISNPDALNDFIKWNSKTKLRTHLDALMYQEAMLDEESYVSDMKEHYSAFNKDERKFIYDFVRKEYSHYLTQNDLYDDNDLARLVLIKIKTNQLSPMFDRLLIDEVQDLTEMQIFTLIHLCKNPSDIFMAGDVSQVINPTFFHKGRIGFIYQNHFSIDKVEVLQLNENYRNSHSIVKVLEELLRLRRATIGTYSYDIEEVATSLEKKEGLPVYVDIPSEELKDIMLYWVNVPSVAIIVPTLSIKQEISQYMVENKRKITTSKIDKVIDIVNIYTVQEIKGQEFEKIISYNMASYYQDSWDEIMNQNVKKGTDDALQYRFYFNTFYVALTRARNNLYLYEQNKNLKIVDQLKPLFDEIKEAASEMMDVSSFDTIEKQIEQAETFFKAQDYDKAYRMYMKANNRKMARISTGFHLLTSGVEKKVQTGFLFLYDSPEFDDQASRFARDEKYWLFKALIDMRHDALQEEDYLELAKGKNIASEVKKIMELTDKISVTRFTLDAIRLMGKVQAAKSKIKIIKLKEI